MNDQARRRFALAAIALGAYAACADTRPEPQHTAFADVPKHHAPDASTDVPDSYVIRLPKPPRAARSQPRRSETRGTAGGACTLDDIKRMESGGRYDAVSASGKYRGAHQFDARTWRGAVTRAGHPEYADTPVNEVPPSVQDAAAAQLYAERGTQPWSVCK